jgi:hypothetical protein
MMNGKQRYRCKSCGYNYTTGFRGKPVELRQQARKLYLEGLGFRAIGRLLEVSNVTVLNWIRAYGLRSRPSLGEPALEAVPGEAGEISTPQPGGADAGGPNSSKESSSSDS